MNIASWNINSVRIRVDQVKDYLKKKKIDILVLQEIKTEDKNFPHEDFKKIGYHSYSFGQKSYNGVAIISKKELKIITSEFKDPLGQSRCIAAEVSHNDKKFLLVSIYLPNGNPINTDKYKYKINWLNKYKPAIEPTKNSSNQ